MNPKRMRTSNQESRSIRKPEAPVDREKHCPFLVRVFCNVGSHNRKEQFIAMDENPIENELHIYTWPDATLREISNLVQDSNTDAQQPNTRMMISIVFPDRKGSYILRKAGIIHNNRRPSLDEGKTLASMGFQPGDFLDIALLQ